MAVTVSAPTRGSRDANAIGAAPTSAPRAGPSGSGAPARAASTSPGSSPCESDSAPYASRSVTIQNPSAPHSEPTIASSNSARRSMPERSGSTRKSITSTRSPLLLVRVAVLVVLHRDRAAALEHDQLVAVGGLERLAVERRGRAAEPHLAPVEAQHEVV